MNAFRRFWCRTYQTFFKLAMPFMPYREPEMLESNADLVKVLENKKIEKVMLVTDNNLVKLGLTDGLLSALKDANIAVYVFDKVLPNPTISLVEGALKEYLDQKCEGIIALGGGSVIDCAKVLGARVVKPNQPISGMKGLLKIGKKLPLLVAIPTTAGTGSETTLAAVITDDKTHYKYAISDFNLIPDYALLDYNLTLKLNPFITATTGMDALTHAVEAYIGRSTTKRTRSLSLEAIKLIKENLIVAYDDGQNTVARQNMLKASYYAGVAFTKSYVGYCHAIAHSVGGQYGVAHGLANAIILPVVLKHYSVAAVTKLAQIAKYIGLDGKNDAELAHNFIKYITSLNKHFGLPKTIKELKPVDIPKLAKLADKEANPLYPVPKLFNAKELEKIYQELVEKQ